MPVLTNPTPSPEDLSRAAALPLTACPRRYCWWWHSGGFDWEVAPAAGCAFFAYAKPAWFPNANIPCRRCAPASDVDHFETREPWLLSDGFAISRWLSADYHVRHEGEIRHDDARGGAYRIEDGDWEPFTITRTPVPEPRWEGIFGPEGSRLEVEVPLDWNMSSDSVEGLLGYIMAVKKWVRVG